MSTEKKAFRFSLSYLLKWVAGFCVALACFSFALKGREGWLVGLPSVFIFTLGVLMIVFLVGDPIGRVFRFAFWLMMASGMFVCVCLAVLLWYINSSIPLFVEQGHAARGDATFKRLRVSGSMVELRYHVSYPPNCEIVSHLSFVERHGQLVKIQ